ncbi:MAG: hypothetical protein LBF88_13150 [Planctomycetaceae bacterium]|nr:hypothetical protein [Planctomycetaceae bacterium]
MNDIIPEAVNLVTLRLVSFRPANDYASLDADEDTNIDRKSTMHLTH